MRFIAAILLLFLIHVSTCAYAQTTTISCHEKNVPLKKVFDDIYNQTGYLFFFKDEPRLMDQMVSLDINNMSIDTFLKLYFGVGPSDYTKEAKTYVIKRKERTPFGVGLSTPRDTLIDVQGSITDMKGDPLSGVTIAVEGTKKMTITDSAGAFSLQQIDPDAVLLCWHVSMDHLRIQIQGQTTLHLRMKEKPVELQNYSVVLPLSNGYQRLPKERATGSFGYIDRTLLNRSVSTSVPDRMENLVPGLLTNHGQSATGIPIREIPLIRGRSTLYANPAPLVILDNFPYDGDLNNINPNDIESISVLRDAAAASIWGLRAGNGVLVINTRRSKVNDTSAYSTLTPLVSYNSSVTFQPAPDLYNVSNISSADFIDWEKDLYAKGYILPGNQIPVTPVVGYLKQVDQGSLSPDVANTLIETLKTQDVRKDIRKYFYKGSVSQQHFIQASASTDNAGYYASAGWDHNTYNLTGSSFDRVSLRLQNILRISTPLTIETGMNYTHTTVHQDANPGFNYRSPVANKGFYPYARLADAQGNPLPVSLDYNPDYLKAAKGLGFPDWNYVPVSDRLLEDNTSKTHDLLINLGARYAFTPTLNLEIKYQYQNGGTDGADLHDETSYYTTNLRNSYIQVDPNTNRLSYPIPRNGGIMDFATKQTTAHQGRIQMNYNKTWSRRNHLTAITGYEIRSVVSTARYNREYGYNPDNGSSIPVNADSNYITWQIGNPRTIPVAAPPAKLVDHFISYYTNASYTYHNLYTLTVSSREDLANLFGVNYNKKGVPLWSAGLAWQINNERFYHWNALSSLNLRATYGRAGNISRLASAYTTVTYTQGGITGTPFNTAHIQGLPNPNLRWEQVGILNIGLDFVTKKRIITGSIEYYSKKATDLMAPALGDPTLGLVQTPGTPGFYYANTATMNGSGIDVQLESHNIYNKTFKWTTNFIFSRAISTVKTFLLPAGTGNTYVDQNGINPRVGKPLYAIYSYRFIGLDPTNGDPMGYYNGKPSKDWVSIYNSTSIDSMVYNGPTQPTIFGALRNTFRWRYFSASFNISYKLGYYFRKPSINYTDLFSTWVGNGDYARRWQRPGDEHTTSVPSVGYPGSNARDFFYINSSVLVEKADHIRLEDIQLSYDLSRDRYPWLPFGNIRLYSYVANVGILWKANKSGIDPYYINIPKEGRRYSVGINVNF
ncbi:MAG: SusC/RagA family TonB-linked outer membrane protein [Chitinophagaceae bacterium]|nr:SusC/RagA family TonB-linked outer membrane protein [Chitinophagaceae bacterium]